MAEQKRSGADSIDYAKYLFKEKLTSAAALRLGNVA